MRDRLVELIEQKQVYGVDQEQERPHEIALLDNDVLADHLLANGVIVPPCKVGDKIYALSASKTKLYLLTITHFVVCENETQIWAVGAPYTSEPAYICNADDLGDNEWVYITREEAEKALKERSEV
jgi:hypothetical protein